MSYVTDSTLRACDTPGCDQTYDAVTGPLMTDEGAWAMHKSFGIHMCPRHARTYWATSEAPHVPSFTGERTAACSCGHPLPGPTLGDMNAAYFAHLEAAA